jgi:hypothetical protein
MNKCENCKKDIEFVGLIWTPEYGPLKGFRLYFDNVECVEAYKEKYADEVGFESQCLNVI